tara:strand:- start:10666 stop:12258 length:1593 start_codon:yes stop_codon:yes gene_type:complete
MGVDRDVFDLHTKRSTHPNANTLNRIDNTFTGHNASGAAPYTRGIHENMYLDRLWTMRQYAGFSDAKSTNKRFLELLENGQSGLSVAFDLPTQLGLNSNSDLAIGEVGKVGVAIDSIHDFRNLFEGIDLSKVSTSMTINAPATSLFALYIAYADECGISRQSLRGTVQNDILKEYIARGLYIFPPKESMRLTTDLMAWSKLNTPQWNTISVSGYHMREAGCTATQEIAFTLANGLEYLTQAINAGMTIDDVAPRMSFFFGCHNDFFEEVAKFRAARKLWHDLVMERFQPKNPKSTMLRFHTQTAGVTLTAQQPLNNAVRVSYQALSAVLGGTQSLHTNSYDEAIGLPTEKSALLALRTQQILADETNVTNSVDPLAGSYLIEELTSKLYNNSKRLVEEMEASGGAMNCVVSGYQQRQIHEAAWNQLKSVEDGTTRVIGVNKFSDEGKSNLMGQIQDQGNAESQSKMVNEIIRDRDKSKAEKCIREIELATINGTNLMESLIDAFKAEVTLGEVNDVLRQNFGTWVAPSGV